MKEHPILFSAPMVRAILAGKKTQTRRIIKPQPQAFVSEFFVNEHGIGLTKNQAQNHVWKCPYGVKGDRLWVRETFALSRNSIDGETDVVYMAEHESGEFERPVKWTPSIHMPRWASRITLEVVVVRVERLQEISQGDAVAEGAPESHHSIDRVSMEFGFPDFSRSYFAQLWQQINGVESWNANPWVWVVEFKRLKGGA